jgi:hypothetical protein
VHEPADPGGAGRVEQHLGPEQVGGDERRRTGDRPVDVRFRREVDDGIVTGQQSAHQVGVPDVTLHESEPGVGQRQIRPVTGVGQQVENRHLGAGRARVPVLQKGPDVAGPDEAGAAGDENPHGWRV